MADKGLIPKEIKLDGKLITARNAASIGMNFRQVTNMKYTDSHPVSVKGMTKVNSTALTTYTEPKTCFHYSKSNPSESHVLVQLFNSGGTAAVTKDNTTAIPSAGNFDSTVIHTHETKSVTDEPNIGRARFSDSPGDMVAMCDGSGAYIWGGTEMRCAAFITSSAAVTNTGDLTDPKDYTERINSNQAEDIAVIGGGIDSYTKLMLHFDGSDGGTTITDSVGTHSPSAVGNASTDTSVKKFGLSSLACDGTGDYVTIPDHADWYFGADPFTIDTWIRFSSLSVDSGICGQYADANNYWIFYYSNSDDKIYFLVKSGGALTASYNFAVGPISENTWYHLALVRNGTSVYFFLNGSSITPTVVTSISTSEVPNLAVVLEVAACNNHGIVLSGFLDESRISKGVARWTANFTPAQSQYTVQSLVWVVGSLLPLSMVKYYILNANIIASTMTAKEWQGSSWETLAITDNTDTGPSLSQTGTVTWSDTGLAKVKYLNNKILYWYQFSIDDGYADLSRVTCFAPMASIPDIWDGNDRRVLSFQIYDNSAYNDNTINVYNDEYDSANTGTFAELDALGTGTDFIVAGFSERMLAVYVNLVAGKGNTTAATSASVYYWDGSDFASVGFVSDGTSTGAISLSRSGVISWTPADDTAEFKTEISGGAELYYYKIAFDKTLSADVQVYYIAGIPAQKTIDAFSFPLMAGDSLWLIDDVFGKRNKIIRSAPGTSVVFNGDGYFETIIGSGDKLTAGCVLFLQLGSDIYEAVVVTKASSTWMLLPTGDGIQKIMASGSIGCVAAGTMKTTSSGSESGQQSRSVAIWQANDGIYAFYGYAPIKISSDIDNYFDKSYSGSINQSYADISESFFDEFGNYHWLFASGSSTTLNEEFVFDKSRMKWSDINRGTGKKLSCATGVVSKTGNRYTYGCLSEHMHRLDYGSTFDGGDITNTIHFGDFPLTDGFITISTIARNIKLVAAPRTTGDVTVSYYKDGNSSADETITLSPESTTKTIVQPSQGMGREGSAVFHSFKITAVSNATSAAFEPIYMGVLYKTGGQDK